VPTFAEQDAPVDEICRTGFTIDNNITFRLGPIMGDNLVPGTYTVHLLFAAPPTAGTIAWIRFQGISAAAPAANERLEVLPGTQIVRMTRTLDITQGALSVNVTPMLGTTYACGAILEPAAGVSGAAVNGNQPTARKPVNNP
jgi:hypothetical protein